MGSSLSREERKKKQERKNKAFQPKKIYYDADGNLRHDWDRPPRNKTAELTKLMQEETAMEEAEEEEALKNPKAVPPVTSANAVVVEVPQEDENAKEKLYYVVSSPWVNAWVAFAFASKTSPDPGPCCNDVLLDRDESNKCFVPKDALRLTRKGRKGDYRHVTEGMWKQICELYPGSGPAIKVNFKQDSTHISDGLYDTSEWNIDQSGFKEEDTGLKLWRRKKKEAPEVKKVEDETPVLNTTEVELSLSMEDPEHQVDPRAAALLGNSSSIVYDNPMKKKKVKAEGAEEKSSMARSHTDESTWLFN